MEWILVMLWWTAPDAPMQRQVIYGPGTQYRLVDREHCEHAAKIRMSFLLQSNWPHRSMFVCEEIPRR
jgi:hypothetical protein